MRRNKKKKRILLFLVSLAILIDSLFLIFSLSPSDSLKVSKINFTPLPFFFAFVFLFSLFFGGFLFANIRRAMFLAFFALGFLVLNFYKINQPFFFVLLAGFFVMLDLFFSYRK